MIKRNLIIPALVFFCLIPVSAQVKKQEPGLKREVTLYNPYKPSLPESKKRSYLPDMNDTVKVRPESHYEISTKPFTPEYIISPIKPATLMPDPLTKLYKSYINLGLGNYLSPLAEISISNERSKKGSLGFYARHYSTNGYIGLQNGKKVFAGYMDNDASLYGRKFFKGNVFGSSVDFTQKTRYAYGYDTGMIGYSAIKKDIRLNYNNIGVKLSLSSTNTDSAGLAYKFGISYNFFHNTKNLYQHSAGLTGIMQKSVLGFTVGSGVTYDFCKIPDILLINTKYIASISPFIKKSSGLWNFKLGLQALLDKNMGTLPELHIYPDLNLSFSVVPSYVSFFAGLSGKLEKNDPLKIISENPFFVADGSLFSMPNTNHSIIVTSGLKGNNGIGGNYLLSASYSLINDMLFYSNIVSPLWFNILHPGVPVQEYGNHFLAIPDNVELINIHGELSGLISDKISYNGSMNWYKYSLSYNDYAWGKPPWDARLGIKYNLRDKIIVGGEFTGTGKRKFQVRNENPLSSTLQIPDEFEVPVHINLNLTAEYRYSKILSVWARFDNLSYNLNYEWAYYPSQRFLCMLGFTYSL
jgi:hypothetical protein